MATLVAIVRASGHIWVVCTVGILVSVAVLAWCNDHILNIVVDWQIDCWFLHRLQFLISVHQRRFVNRLLWNRSWSMWTMMARCILVVEVCCLVLQIGWSSMSMVLILVDTSVRLAWIVHMIPLTRRSIIGTNLLRMSSILPSPESSRTSTCSCWSTSWLIDSDKFIDEVVEALLIITLGELLVSVVVKVLMQDLLEIFMQLLSPLILWEMLFVIFN